MPEIPQHQCYTMLGWKGQLKNHEYWKRYEFIFLSSMKYCRPLLEVLGSSKSKPQIMFPHEWEIPVFIGTQFGAIGIKDFPVIGSKYVAIIGRSALSGTLAGISIYEVDLNGQEGIIGRQSYNLR